MWLPSPHPPARAGHPHSLATRPPVPIHQLTRVCGGRPSSWSAVPQPPRIGLHPHQECTHIKCQCATTAQGSAVSRDLPAPTGARMRPRMRHHTQLGAGRREWQRRRWFRQPPPPPLPPPPAAQAALSAPASSRPATKSMTRHTARRWAEGVGAAPVRPCPLPRHPPPNPSAPAQAANPRAPTVCGASPSFGLAGMSSSSPRRLLLVLINAAPPWRCNREGSARCASDSMLQFFPTTQRCRQAQASCSRRGRRERQLMSLLANTCVSYKVMTAQAGPESCTSAQLAAAVPR